VVTVPGERDKARRVKEAMNGESSFFVDNIEKVVAFSTPKRKH
jgi:hypothetical protein